MANVTRQKQPPIPQPDKVLVELDLSEASSLFTLLFRGTAGSTVDLLGLRSLVTRLERAGIDTNSVQFRQFALDEH